MSGNLTIVPQDYVPITASNTAVVAYRGIYVGGSAGNVALQLNGGATRTVPVIANQVLIGQISKVLSTGTTATTLFGLV